jgi:REP element-mobilizing transposase RayT
MTGSRINLAPQELERLLRTASAQAAVLMDADTVGLKAGRLSPTGFCVLCAALQSYWPISSQIELNRYVGLCLDQKYYFIYSQCLPKRDYLLGLVFPLETPLNRIRQAMTVILRGILDCEQTEFHPNDVLERSLQFTLEPDPASPPRSTSASWGTEIDHVADQIKDSFMPEESNNQAGTADAKSRGNQKRMLSYGAPLKPAQAKRLVEQSPADPVELAEEIPWQRIRDKGALASDRNQDPALSSWGTAPLPDDVDRPNLQKGRDLWQSFRGNEQRDDDLVSILQDGFDFKTDLVGLDEWLLPPALDAEHAPEESGSELIDDTQPQLIDVNIQEGESSDVDVSDVTFYLVPRLDTHHLLGELSHKLRCWLPVICETYGWQLDLIAVRPDYLKWTLRDFPEPLIREMLTILRRKTSERIFRVFPELIKGNPTSDFWSPGYLVDMLNQDFSTQLLISHLSKSRLG